MINPGGLPDERAFVDAALKSSSSFVAEALNTGDDVALLELWIERGGPFPRSGAGPRGSEERGEFESYRSQVETAAAVWMDNTSIAVSASLLEAGRFHSELTTTTLWDLAAMCRAVVCSEHIYHHQHPLVDDAELNELLGDEVFRPLAFPESQSFDPSGTGHNVQGRFISEWWRARQRLSDLARSEEGTLDHRELLELRDGWSTVLGYPVSAHTVVDDSAIDAAFDSPVQLSLGQIPLIGQLAAPQVSWSSVVPDNVVSAASLAEGLTENNLRSYVNSSFANDLRLPYQRGIARMPFARYVDRRAARVQEHLIAAELLDSRYAEIAGEVRLRLPVFLALVVSKSETPADIWDHLRELRSAGARFRKRRVELDCSLADRDLKVTKELARALNTDVVGLVDLAGDTLAAAALNVNARMVEGDLDQTALGVAAAAAAAQELVSSSVATRVLWWLRKPQLKFMNDLVDESRHLTEALPRASRIWGVQERRLEAIGAGLDRIAAWVGQK